MKKNTFFNYPHKTLFSGGWKPSNGFRMPFPLFENAFSGHAGRPVYSQATGFENLIPERDFTRVCHAGINKLLWKTAPENLDRM